MKRTVEEPTPLAVLESVCAPLGITVEQLRGASRVGILVEARRQAMRALRDQGLSLFSIGFLLHRHHSTILYHLQDAP